MGYSPRIYKEYIKIGDLFDKSIALYHSGEPIELILAEAERITNDKILVASSQEEISDLENIQVMVQAMLLGYTEKFEQINIKPHLRVNVPVITGYRLGCELDGFYQNGVERWIAELKTSTTIDKNYIDKLDTDFQMNCYFFGATHWFHKPITGVLYRIVKKPSIRQKKTETRNEFLKRLMLEFVEKKDDYFYQQKIYKNQLALKIFEKEIVDIFKDMEQCYKQDRWYKSGEQCIPVGRGNCQYLQYCNDPRQEILETFYKKEK
jgi:hypothetical protein